MAFELPPIVKAAEGLMVEVEQTVRRFARYHKYTYGSELRSHTMNVARLSHRAWRDSPRRAEWISKLVWLIDDLKLLLQLGKQVEAFASFAHFEALARRVSDLGRQCGAWKREHSKGQNVRPQSGSAQRPQILSTRAASAEANV